MSKYHRFFAFFIAFGLCAIAPLASSQNADSDARSKTINFWRPGDPGVRLHIDGRVLNEAGKGVMGAMVNIRQADGSGVYQLRYRGTVTTGEEGGYAFSTVLPGQYYGNKHIHVLVTHENYPPLETQILFKSDPNLDEESTGKHGIMLEKAQIKGEKLLIGRFDIVLKSISQ